MIVKEARADRWAALVGLVVIALRILNAATTDVKAQTFATLSDQFDADFTAVSANHVTSSAAFLWATFFNDLTVYLLIGVCGVVLGAGLVANETGSGSIFVLLSRPVSRTRALLTKYGVAAALSLILCALCGGMALAVGVWQGVAAPPLGGFLISVLLLWLGMMFVVGVTMLYSTLIPSALGAGILGFFTIYLMSILPLFHNGTAPNVHYYLGGPDWSMPNYWGSLGIYAGVDSPLKSLIVSVIAAAIPAALTLWLFVRKAF
jgi:ABC-type transport system involved in multi-copper enzyme maturation permease subunit